MRQYCFKLGDMVQCNWNDDTRLWMVTDIFYDQTWRKEYFHLVTHNEEKDVLLEAAVTDWSVVI